MSWLFSRPEHLDGLVIVRPTMFDNPGGVEPFIETCASEKLPWAATPAIHSFDQFPPPELFGGLVEAYGDWRRGTGEVASR